HGIKKRLGQVHHVAVVSEDQPCIDFLSTAQNEYRLQVPQHHAHRENDKHRDPKQSQQVAITVDDDVVHDFLNVDCSAQGEQSAKDHANQRLSNDITMWLEQGDQSHPWLFSAIRR